jgi:mono/diheme cytochrome c family protein
MKIVVALSAAAALAAAVVLAAARARAAEPPRRTPELVAKGKASYEANCAVCHGPAGLGDGEAGAALEPKPRNLVTGAFRNPATVDGIHRTLEKGIEGTTMVSFSHLPPDELWALSYYVLELRTKGKGQR